MELLDRITELMMPLLQFLHLLLLGTLSDDFHLAVGIFCHFDFLIQGALVCVLRVLHFGLDFAKLLLHLTLMFFLDEIFIF